MKILFFCAHPDDLEFYIGYLLYALGKHNKDNQGLQYIRKDAKKGKPEVHIAAMTRGEMSGYTHEVRSTTEAAKVRTEELNNALAELGHPPPDYLGFFDGYIKITDTAINRVRTYIQKMKPDFVVAPEPVYTWYNHNDHRNTGKLIYYAIQQWHREWPQEKKPVIYYYTAMFHQYYFPRFQEWKPSIIQALLAHKSQKNLLEEGKSIGTLIALFHGLHTKGYKMAEALRRQYRPHIDHPSLKPLLLQNWTLFKRIIYYIFRRLLDDRFKDIDYSDRFEFIDGTLQDSEFKPLIPKV